MTISSTVVAVLNKFGIYEKFEYPKSYLTVFEYVIACKNAPYIPSLPATQVATKLNIDYVILSLYYFVKAGLPAPRIYFQPMSELGVFYNIKNTDGFILFEYPNDSGVALITIYHNGEFSSAMWEMLEPPFEIPSQLVKVIIDII